MAKPQNDIVWRIFGNFKRVRPRCRGQFLGVRLPSILARIRRLSVRRFAAMRGLPVS